MHNKDSPMLLTLIVIVAGVFALTLSGLYYSSSDNVGNAYQVIDQSGHYRFCYDGDGGKNYYLQGEVLYGDQDGNSTVKDYCRNYDSPTLVEYYCDGLTIASEDLTCPYGCLNGACLQPSSQTCVDSDFGFNGFIKGTVALHDEFDIVSASKTDYCEDNSTVIEYGCGADNSIISQKITCNSGCDNGVCLKDINKK